jgi:membrane-bound serine protease (ClpP class)
MISFRRFRVKDDPLRVPAKAVAAARIPLCFKRLEKRTELRLPGRRAARERGISGRLAAALALAGGLGLLLGAFASPEPAAEVLHLKLDSILHPVARQILADALVEADGTGAAALVVELSTPGGLLTSTREISTAMLAARTPVVVWVAPAGSQAASAGFFVLLSADFAAMAPGTNTGAAHPVGGQGESIAGDMGDKVLQDTAAMARSLAARHGRSVELAEKAVLESRSFTEQEAFAAKLVDVVAADLPALFAALEGQEYDKPAGKGTLRLEGAPVREIRATAVQRFLSAIAHPNIAYLLMSLGMLGIYFELAHPGAVLPGVVGGISLLLGLFALSVLPVSYTGVGLILLAIVFFVAEIKVTSYGLLAVGGIISLVLGSLMLFKSAEPALRLSRGLIFASAASAAAVAGFLAVLAARAQSKRITT